MSASFFELCYNFFMLLKLIILVLICLIILSSLLLYLLLKKYKRIKSDVLKASQAFRRARYGDINIRVNNFCLKELENSINRLLETINDRELMIKEYQNALSKKNLSLEEILKQEKQLQLFKEEFVATLTHDMKVPVIAELNSLNFLLEGRFGDLNDKQSEILNLMKTSNQELKDLIENILETYKLDQKKLELKISKNNFNEFIKSIINEMTPIVLKSNHNINMNINNTEDLHLDFDEFQLKRVIKNLVQNALTFSLPCEPIDIETVVDNNNLKVSITNKGTSISQEDLDLIFNKYYQGHSKFRKAGTGLGLYLARQIMFAHNGNIGVDSSKEGYTTFIITLPLKYTDS